MNPLHFILIIFLIILIYITLRYILSKSSKLTGLINAKTSTMIDSKDLETNIQGSNASNFAYSIWFYINDWNYRYGENKVIFGRTESYSSNNSTINACPAVILGNTCNDIVVSLSHYNGTNTNENISSHKCTISDIPLQKWVNLTMSVYNNTIDIYIDGKLSKTCLMPGVAAINPNANVFVTPGGGFDGWTSKLQYYTHALNPQDVWNNYIKGYTNNWFGNLFGSYNLKVSVTENGNPQGSISI